VSLAVCKAGAMVKKIPLYQVCGYGHDLYYVCIHILDGPESLYIGSTLQTLLETKLWCCLYLLLM
jgi:hypothetical protein